MTISTAKSGSSHINCNKIIPSSLVAILLLVVLVGCLVRPTTSFYNHHGIVRHYHSRHHRQGDPEPRKTLFSFPKNTRTTWSNRCLYSPSSADFDSDEDEQQQHPPTGGGATLDGEEPLSVLFQRAVALHRAGESQQALETYDLFLKAAKQCNVPAMQYAEVHVNIGAIQLKFGNVRKAKQSLETALQYRPMGTAYVNLAVLLLKEAASTSKSHVTMQVAVEKAKRHCQDAIALNDDPRTVMAAQKLLNDIQQKS